MRRWISFFLLLVLLTISLPVTFAAALPHVVDEANLLTSHELQSLSQQAETIGDRYQVDVVILTVVSLEGKDPESYADDYYDQRGYGLGSDRSGILLLISTESRDWPSAPVARPSPGSRTRTWNGWRRPFSPPWRRIATAPHSRTTYKP